MTRRRPTGKSGSKASGLLHAAIVAVTLLAAGCGSQGTSSGSTSSPTTSATTTLAATSLPATTLPATTAAEPAATSALSFPPSQTPIEPGTYRWDGFEPSITIALGPGWSLGHDNAAFFDLFRGSDFPSVTFARFTHVYVDGTKRIPVVDAATVVATLMGRTDMAVTALAHVELGGQTGQQFDVVTLAAKTPLFYGPAGDFRLDPEFTTRYRVLDFPGGGVLVIGIHTRDGGFDKGLALAEPVVESLAVER